MDRRGAAAGGRRSRRRSAGAHLRASVRGGVLCLLPRVRAANVDACGDLGRVVFAISAYRSGPFGNGMLRVFGVTRHFLATEASLPPLSPMAPGRSPKGDRQFKAGFQVFGIGIPSGGLFGRNQGIGRYHRHREYRALHQHLDFHGLAGRVLLSSKDRGRNDTRIACSQSQQRRQGVSGPSTRQCVRRFVRIAHVRDGAICPSRRHGVERDGGRRSEGTSPSSCKVFARVAAGRNGPGDRAEYVMRGCRLAQMRTKSRAVRIQ